MNKSFSAKKMNHQTNTAQQPLPPAISPQCSFLSPQSAISIRESEILNLKSKILNLKSYSSSRSGQALAEFVVFLIPLLAIISVLIICSGIQDSSSRQPSLMIEHTKAMATARKAAAEQSLLDANILSKARYIHEVTTGADKKQYTRDDTSTAAVSAEFDSLIIQKTVTTPTDWGIINQTPNNRFGTLAGNGNPSSVFGLVSGSEKKSIAVDALPAVRHLFGLDHIDIECNVWMTQINGLY